MTVKNLIIGIAIFILMVSVGVYGISTLYGKSPEYMDFCPNIINEQVCMQNNGIWINNSVQGIPAEKQPIAAGGYCNWDYDACQKKYDSEREKYSKNIFLITLPLAIIVIAVGGIIFGLEAVGGGLMAGGVGILFYGIVSYWQYAEDWIKFALSFIGLIIVIWLAYYLNKKIGKKS